jgi:hypothetical protein
MHKLGNSRTLPDPYYVSHPSFSISSRLPPLAKTPLCTHVC